MMAVSLLSGAQRRQLRDLSAVGGKLGATLSRTFLLGILSEKKRDAARPTVWKATMNYHAPSDGELYRFIEQLEEDAKP